MDKQALWRRKELEAFFAAVIHVMLCRLHGFSMRHTVFAQCRGAKTLKRLDGIVGPTGILGASRLVGNAFLCCYSLFLSAAA